MCWFVDSYLLNFVCLEMFECVCEYWVCGYEVVLVSVLLLLYLEKWVKMVGFDVVFVMWFVFECGVFVGWFDGENCWGL